MRKNMHKKPPVYRKNIISLNGFEKGTPWEVTELIPLEAWISYRFSGASTEVGAWSITGAWSIYRGGGNMVLSEWVSCWEKIRSSNKEGTIWKYNEAGRALVLLAEVVREGKEGS